VYVDVRVAVAAGEQAISTMERRALQYGQLGPSPLDEDLALTALYDTDRLLRMSGGSEQGERCRDRQTQ
jgi:hypothetical protein